MSRKLLKLIGVAFPTGSTWHCTQTLWWKPDGFSSDTVIFCEAVSMEISWVEAKGIEHDWSRRVQPKNGQSIFLTWVNKDSYVDKISYLEPALLYWTVNGLNGMAVNELEQSGGTTFKINIFCIFIL